ncbi:MAG: hypothetical protein GWP58_12365 [Gammaproteobacteria bacterium]|nr:hypothetical protein [Gammaproteobacteria bacterium]
MHPIKYWFYFNGFNSAILNDYSDNPKIVAVAEFARDRGYCFIPESICFRRAREHSEEIMGKLDAEVDEVVFCGSSMGGWLARIMQLKLSGLQPGLRTAAVAFNPAFDLVMYGHMLLGPQVNHVTGEEYTWTREHGRHLSALEREVNYDSNDPFFVFVDKDDELIGWEQSARRHSSIAKFVAFEGGCHSFDHYKEALQSFALAFCE